MALVTNSTFVGHMRDANFMLSDADRRATNFQFEIGEDGGGGSSSSSSSTSSTSSSSSSNKKLLGWRPSLLVARHLTTSNNKGVWQEKVNLRGHRLPWGIVSPATTRVIVFF